MADDGRRSCRIRIGVCRAPAGFGVGYRTGWAGVIAGYRDLSFDQGGSDLVNKLSMGGAFLAVNFTF